MKINHFKQYIEEADPSSRLLDGFDTAIVGLDSQGRLVYSFRKLSNLLIEKGYSEQQSTNIIALCFVTNPTINLLYSNEI
jgi:hypothetical protein